MWIRSVDTIYAYISIAEFWTGDPNCQSIEPNPQKGKKWQLESKRIVTLLVYKKRITFYFI